MPKISIIGICGNSYFLETDHFHEKGETIVADSVFEEIGGKGINQAIAAARMGANVSFLAAVGDDQDGRNCIHLAEKEGLKGTFCVKKAKRTTFAFILTDKDGNNQVTGYHGAELSVDDTLAFEDEIANSDILLLQQEVPVEVNETAVQLAKKHNVKVILNPAPPRGISKEVLKGIYMVTPNEQEKRSIKDSCFLQVITTLGEKGCLINEEDLIPAIDVKPVDTTGAGDVFNGVLAVCLAEGMELTKACRYAVTASGISVGIKNVLAAIPYRAEIERRLNNE